MSMMLNPYRFGAGAAGIQYVGGVVTAPNYVSPLTFSLSGVLTGGIAASPNAGDFCIVSYSQSSTADRTNRSIANAISEFTLLTTDYASDTNDANFTVKYKFLESPIDYDIIIGIPNATTTMGALVNIQVFRGVNVASPFDVAAVTTNTLNTALPDPGSITPITAGAVIGMFAAGARGATLSDVYTSSDYDAFVAQSASASSRSLAQAFGRKAWTSGAFDAAALGGIAANVADACLSVTFALRPA